MLFGVKSAEAPELPVPCVPAASQGMWLTSPCHLLTPEFIIQAVQAHSQATTEAYPLGSILLKPDASGFKQNCCVWCFSQAHQSLLLAGACSTCLCFGFPLSRIVLRAAQPRLGTNAAAATGAFLPLVGF